MLNFNLVDFVGSKLSLLHIFSLMKAVCSVVDRCLTKVWLCFSEELVKVLGRHADLIGYRQSTDPDSKDLVTVAFSKGLERTYLKI